METFTKRCAHGKIMMLTRLTIPLTKHVKMSWNFVCLPVMMVVVVNR